MNIRHITATLLLALCLLGCALTEYGTHSLGTTPFEVPGLNSSEDAFRPRAHGTNIGSGDAYHGNEGASAKTGKWCCGGSTRCRFPDSGRAKNPLYGGEVCDKSKSRAKRDARADAVKLCTGSKDPVRPDWARGVVEEVYEPGCRWSTSGD